MNIIIDHMSAVQYWLYRQELDSMKAGWWQEIPNDFASNELAGYISEKYELNLPIHISVADKARRHQGDLFSCHYMAGKLPEKSFIQIEKEIYVAAPELCFLRAANYLDFSQLVVLANDLCAIYRRNKQEPFGQIRQEPITSVEKIMEYLDKAGNVNGIKKARNAIAFGLNRSNSPMESKEAAVSQISIGRGGYHLLKPELNYFVRMNDQGKRLVKSDYLCCDMVWPDKKVIVEYDSNLSHLEKKQHYFDKKRLTALNLSGYTVISITAENLRNFWSIEETFFLIRAKLGMRPYLKEFEQAFDKRYDVVKGIFFSGSNIYGF